SFLLLSSSVTSNDIVLIPLGLVPLSHLTATVEKRKRGPGRLNVLPTYALGGGRRPKRRLGGGNGGGHSQEPSRNAGDPRRLGLAADRSRQCRAARPHANLQ